MVAVLSIVTPDNSITDVFLLLTKVAASVLSDKELLPPPIANSACVLTSPFVAKTVALLIPFAISLLLPLIKQLLLKPQYHVSI